MSASAGQHHPDRHGPGEMNGIVVGMSVSGSASRGLIT
jgi:hypothetical protein